MRNKYMLLPALVLTVSSAYASTIDYRHEWKDTRGNSQQDRLLLSHRFHNGFGVSLEGKWKGGTDKNKPYNEVVGNGTEVVANYLYKLMPDLNLESGMSIETGSNFNSYRPYLLVQYNLIEDLTSYVRYRPFYKRIPENIGTNAKTSETGYSLTAFVGYKFLPDMTLGYEFEYKKVTTAGVILSDKHNYEWTHDFKLTYKLDKNWNPYVAIGNIPGSKNSDERQTRYRIGFAYQF